ncbi:uncharacterized protein LOC112903550 [Panicum hallii]|uniref:uncharacterized protein LOC112903550 n=1 Tax=Panicum hallii TaxID=206008 RepID=UPI000DF4DB71|nr:uncharacterized protein LOC112903550 [Panicum hallii]
MLDPIKVDDDNYMDVASSVNSWIHRVLKCQVKALRRSCVFADDSNYRHQIWVSLRLEEVYFRTPLLESMPELVEAYYIFRRDLRWCPTFSKLKSLVEHKYKVEIKHKYKVEIKGRPDATNRSTIISQYLQIVEVKCGMVDERILSILNFRGTYDICKKTANTGFLLCFYVL